MSISAKKFGINYTTAFITQITAKAMSTFMAKSMTIKPYNTKYLTKVMANVTEALRNQKTTIHIIYDKIYD